MRALVITNSDQMKRTCHSKGCPNSHINTQCTPSGSNAGVYSRMQTVTKVLLSEAPCTRCGNSAMVVAGTGERTRSSFIMTYMCSIIDERSGALANQGNSCTLFPPKAFALGHGLLYRRPPHYKYWQHCLGPKTWLNVCCFSVQNFFLLLYIIIISLPPS